MLRWIQTYWKSIFALIILGVLVWLLNKIFESKGVKDFFQNKTVKKIIEEIKSFIGQGLTIAFFITLLGSTLLHILKPEIFPNFIAQFIIAGLTLGAFSIAMATLINQAKKQKLTDEAIRYRLFSEDFILSGIYFIFVYFFWMVVNYNQNTNVPFLKLVVEIYSVLTVIALIVAIISLPNFRKVRFLGILP